MKKENNSHLIKNLDNITKTFVKNVPIENYFNFNSEKKMTTQYLLLKFVTKSIINEKTKKDQNILKTLISGLLKRNEEIENYELAEISKDIKTNFDLLYDMLNEQPKPKRIIKTNKQIE
jgi:hypothetical protein